MIELQNENGRRSNEADVGKTFKVLIEGKSKKSVEQLFGRNSQNKVVVFPREKFQPGQYVDVKIDSCTAATLLGKAI